MRPVLNEYSLYACTYNLGEAQLDRADLDWIPLGMDIYSIAVQEALDVEALEQVILQHLQTSTAGDNASCSSSSNEDYPAYTSYVRSIGSDSTSSESAHDLFLGGPVRTPCLCNSMTDSSFNSCTITLSILTITHNNRTDRTPHFTLIHDNAVGYHGFIGIIVVVRTSLVASGRVSGTRAAASNKATGENLIVATASNKGAVSVPIQVHGKDIVFLSAHLPSDTGHSSSHYESRNKAVSGKSHV